MEYATALLKTFRLDRISEIEETGQSFVLDPKDRASDPHFHKWDLCESEQVSVVCEVDATLASVAVTSSTKLRLNFRGSAILVLPVLRFETVFRPNRS